MRKIRTGKEIEVKINGYSLSMPSEKKVMGFLFSRLISHMAYMSDEAITNWMNNIYDLIDEITDLKLMRKLTHYGRQSLQNFNREHICNYVANIILSSEGLGLLPGFGLATYETEEGRKKVKGKFYINPEKSTIWGKKN